VDAEDLVVDDGGQWHAVEGQIAFFPDLLALVCPETHLALVQEGLFLVVVFPPVHVAGLVVASEQDHFVRVQQLQWAGGIDNRVRKGRAGAMWEPRE
jgi:hypothetical protein